MYLAIDIGTGTCKTALADGENYFMKQAVITTRSRGNQAEQDADQWWNSLKVIIPQLISEAGVDAGEIKGISVSSHSPSLIPVGKSGEPLAPCLIWQDRRAVSQALSFEKITGQQSNPSFFEPKILWVKENMPDIYKRTDVFLQPKDYIIRLLTGHSIIDRAAAYFMALYSRDRKTWIERGTGLDLNKLPEIIDNWCTAGETLKEPAGKLGLKEGIPVIAGGIDAYCEALGAGVIDAGQICDMTGTSSCIMAGLNSPEKASASANNLQAVPHVIPGRYLYILPMSSTGGALSWFLENFAESYGGYDERFSVLEEALAKSRPGSNNLIFLPYLAGERSPIWDKDARGVFFGLTGQHTRYDFLRAVMEGVAFGVKHNLEQINRVISTGSGVLASGGGSSLGSWNQIKADITGLKYHELQIKDGALLGGIILAAHAVEKQSFPDLIERYVEIKKTYCPSGLNNIYQNLFTKYKELYKSTNHLMKFNN